jgi:hypothetical protein
MNTSNISDSLHAQLLELLRKGDLDQVIQLTTTSEIKANDFFNFFSRKKKNNTISFARHILNSCLTNKLVPAEYSKIQELVFKKGFLNELIKLGSILFALEEFKKAPDKENQIALTLLECIRDGVMYIGKNVNNYSQNPINGKNWMDGAGLRTQADGLANYFIRKKDDQHILEALFLRVKLTNSIMSHYPNLVGPDMIAIARQHEKMGNAEKAKSFYNAVVKDFTSLVENVHEGLHDPEVGTNDDDQEITQSLIDALEGLKRLGETIESHTLEHAKRVLNQLEDLNGK